MPSIDLGPPQRRAILWILAHMVYYSQHKRNQLSLTDFADFLRRARWKTHQRARRQERVGRYLSAVLEESEPRTSRGINAQNRRNSDCMYTRYGRKIEGSRRGNIHSVRRLANTELGTTQCLAFPGIKQLMNEDKQHGKHSGRVRILREPSTTGRICETRQ